MRRAGTTSPQQLCQAKAPPNNAALLWRKVRRRIQSKDVGLRFTKESTWQSHSILEQTRTARFSETPCRTMAAKIFAGAGVSHGIFVFAEIPQPRIQ